MEIRNAVIEDIDEIFRLYKVATDLQKEKKMVHWPVFERDLVEREIAEKRLWKMLIDNAIACVWTTAFDDPQIWLKRNEALAIYIHRIAIWP